MSKVSRKDIYKKHLIYALIDPTTNELRYVGRSSSWLFRPRRHWGDPEELSYTTYCANWIKSLLQRDLVPEIEVLEQFEPSENINDIMNDAEIFWIAYFKSIGARLTNIDPGGKIRATTKETISKRVAKTIGRKLSEEHKKKIGQSQIGKKISSEMREKLIKSNTGRVVSEETREKLRQANLGKKHTQETKDKVSVKGKGRIVSDKTRQNMSLANKGKKLTEECKSKLAEAARRQAQPRDAKGHFIKTKNLN